MTSLSSFVDLTCREEEAAGDSRASDYVHMDMAASGVNSGSIPRPAPREGVSAAERVSMIPGVGPLTDSTNTTAAALAGTLCRTSDGDATAPQRKKRKAQTERPKEVRSAEAQKCRRAVN